MDDDTNAETYAKAYARTITVEVEGADDPWRAASELVHGALDADYLVTSRGDVKAVHLVVGTGGPHVELQHYVGAEGVMVRVWWWQDYAEAHVYAPALAADLDAVAQAWQDAYVMDGRPAGVRR
jgi:hypothetical protein